jgi:hypothetical protein
MKLIISVLTFFNVTYLYFKKNISPCLTMLMETFNRKQLIVLSKILTVLIPAKMWTKYKHI